MKRFNCLKCGVAVIDTRSIQHNELCTTCEANERTSLDYEESKKCYKPAPEPLPCEMIQQEFFT